MHHSKNRIGSCEGCGAMIDTNDMDLYMDKEDFTVKLKCKAKGQGQGS